MRYLVYTVATTTALFAGGMLMNGRAEAAPVGAPNALGIAADGLDVSENAQFRFRGKAYCWYEGGWQGPGFYWCGYGSRHGLGWGGGQGWQGWRGGSRSARGGDGDRRGSQFQGRGQGRSQFQRQGEGRSQLRQGDGKRNGQFQRGSQIKGDGQRGTPIQRSGEVQGGDGKRSIR
jgi:hypothetical protein